MEPVECSLNALSNLDGSDFEALQRMNEACLAVLLDPALWAWMTALTVICIAVGALIGWFKGRTAAGILWAAVLGPIGWIIVALGKSKLPVCASCAKRNSVNATVCRYCSASMKPSMPRTARAQMKADDNHMRHPDKGG